MEISHLKKQAPEIADLINAELKRQQEGLVMIPSENFASPAVLEATGSILTNKYAEGYPNKRYYTGNQYIDQIEQLAIDRAKKLFSAEHANVQPHSGSSANMACYSAVLNPGDKIMAMNLSHGGHLTHGHKVNFSGKTYQFISYGVNQETEQIDMDQIRQMAKKEQPKLILSGATSYPRKIDFEQFASIAQEVGAYAMADISHIVGLCLAGLHSNPCPTNDLVMTTTTKTLRGPRSAIILSKINDRWKSKYHPEEKKNLAQLIDSAVFPGLQGGPFEHIIAAKAVAFAEASKPEFQIYQKQIINNAQALAKSLLNQGLRLISGGTDNHLLLIDCSTLKITGKEAADSLADAGIYTNFNLIPFDTGTAFNPSGLRLGTPALTTRGLKENDFQLIGELISLILKNINKKEIKEKVKQEIKQLTEKYPLYQNL